MGNLDPKRVSTKQQGDAAEALALAHLQAQGLRLLVPNYRTPGRGGGEIDLIMRDPAGALVLPSDAVLCGLRGITCLDWPLSRHVVLT